MPAAPAVRVLLPDPPAGRVPVPAASVPPRWA